MSRSSLALVAAVVLGLAGSWAFGAPGYMQMAAAPALLPDGNWEYVYDVYGDATGYLVGCGLSGFDADNIVNQWTYSYGGVTGTLVQNWGYVAAHGGGGAIGSYSTDGTTWTLSGDPWTMDNPWHAPSEYVSGASSLPIPGWYYPGVIATDGQSLGYTAKWAAGNAVTGLVKTFRIVHPNAPGAINWWVSSYYGDGNGTIEGPGSGLAPWDFDADGDVDADDIDILCANMGGDLDPYDLNEDGAVDEDDMIYMVENLVEYDTDGDGTPDGAGTYRGDFNLDGVVNATDLQIQKGSFGASGVGYADGNANCDTVVNATDLQILKATFGSSAAAVPEPLTLGLMAVGGVALLRRRSR